MRLAADLNNMRWKIRPEEVLLEVGRPFGSKTGLQKITEVDFYTVKLDFAQNSENHGYPPSSLLGYVAGEDL